MSSVIAKCICSHEYQDGVYGKGMRVHNVTMQKSKKELQGRRCTSCNGTDVSHKARQAEWKHFKHRRSSK